jgi:MinD-like ATPase involved in chromosome partitioning or flagellar assembly
MSGETWAVHGQTAVPVAPGGPSRFEASPANLEHSATPPVRLLIVAQPGRAQGMYAATVADARFAVQAVATSPADARAKLALDPEAVLAEIVVFDGPGEFADAFAGYPGALWAVAPAGLAAADAGAVRAVRPVQALVEGEPDFAVLAGELYAAVVSRRASTESSPISFIPSRDPGVAMVGWRAIAVWSPQGGVGKSTVALALALEAVSRRLPALLVALAAPDMTPLILEGIRPEPNLLTWCAAPTAENLRASVQVHRKTGLHLLTGFRDPVALGGYEAQTGPASLTRLAYTAAQAGYGILVLDVSAPEIAPAALSAANTLVLVARPDTPGIHSALQGLHLVKDVMAGQHAIPPEAIYLAVNRARDTTLRPDEVVRWGKGERRDFPPLGAAIADDAGIEVAVNRREPAYYASDALRAGARALGDLLFPAAAATPIAPARPARALRLGPVRVRL